MKLIVGLGNPSSKYEYTRHNVGFDVIDLFRNELQLGKKFKKEHHSLVIECELESNRLLLAKPQTFMNSSGMAVQSLASYNNISLEDIIVIYDDLNLDFGLLRIRRSGSAGGHKGVKSIIESLGNQSFLRIRIGIGQPSQDTEVIDYVLSKFTSKEREEIEKAEQSAVEALKIMILEGVEPAMNKYNIRQKDKES